MNSDNLRAVETESESETSIPTAATPTSPPRPKPKRSRGGCWTCREAKVKCDEQRPTCRRCIRLYRACDYAPRPRKKYTRRKEGGRGGEENDCTDSSRQGSAQPSTPGLLAAPTGAICEDLSSDTGYVCSVGSGLGSTIHIPTTSLDAASSDARPSPASPSPGLPFPLSPRDQQATHCFRFVVSTAVDTKVPEYSGPSIIWQLAQQSAMVLHMVCALGSREMCYRALDSDQDQQGLQETALEHYGACMRLLVDTTAAIEETSDLDCILATLWLMIAYEQKFGDGSGVGLTAHLKGAASIVQLRLRNLKDLMIQHDTNNQAAMATFPPLDARSRESHWKISPFAGRMIVWIAFLDGCAAFHGFGGDFNRALGEIMMTSDDPASSRIRGFNTIHHYSALMGRRAWGSSYPQEQLLEDLENRQLLYLYGELGQLRYLLAKLATAHETEEQNTADYASLVYRAIRDISNRYSELLDVATEFGGASGHTRTFIRNIRFVVPLYQAIVLCFLRFTDRATSLRDQRQLALREITTLAFQAHHDEGESAMARIAWPLLVAVLETDDLLHRDWILARFEHLKNRGENYRRAHRVLQAEFADPLPHQGILGFLRAVRRNELDRFVI